MVLLAQQLPPVPTDGNWAGWIITVLIMALLSTIGIAGALIKRQEAMYLAEISDRDKTIVELKKEFAEFRVASQAFRKMLHEETTKCHQEREALAIKVARLESRIERLEPKSQS